MGFNNRNAEFLLQNPAFIFDYLFYGCVTVFASRITAVCDNARPVKVAPVFSVIPVLDKITPLKFEEVPKMTSPPTCQNICSAFAPPLSVMFTPELTLRFPCIWKIQTSDALPEIITPDGAVTVFVHL